MAEPDGTAGVDDSPDDSDALESAEKLEEDGDEADGDEADGDEAGGDEADGDEAGGDEADGDEADGDELAEDEQEGQPPRRRLVSELLEGQESVEGSARADLQLVAPPVHPEVGDTGQPIYQLDLSSDEPEGTLLEPDPSVLPPEPDYAAPATETSSEDGSVSEAGDVHAVLKQMIANRDRQVMAAERDGIGAYELAAGIDHFVASLIDAVRRSDD